MDPYGGFEPQVGQIRALRTFRIGPDGCLYPLFSSERWHDGSNTACCRRKDRPPHRSPDPDCTCGFYAFGTEPAVSEHPRSRHVLAVISCWGRIIAGTRGLRAEHCRIEALWMSPAVPEELVARVIRNHPSVVVHRDRDRMLADHPATDLDCYERPARGRCRPAGRRWWSAAIAAVVLSVLPTELLGGARGAALLWVVLGVAFGAGALLSGRPEAQGESSGRRLLCLGTSVWLFAHFLGPFGLVFVQLPLLQAAAVTGLRHMCLLLEGRRIPAKIG